MLLALRKRYGANSQLPPQEGRSKVQATANTCWIFKRLDKGDRASAGWRPGPVKKAAAVRTRKARQALCVHLNDLQLATDPGVALGFDVLSDLNCATSWSLRRCAVNFFDM